jgi:cytochrome c-type biogenesis protein
VLEQLLNVLSEGIDRSAGWALLAAFGWGVVSIVFSPCHLASVPLVVGFLASRRDRSTRSAFVLSLLFSLGVLVSIAVIGLVTWALGRLLGDLGPVGNVAVAVVFFVFGLYLLGLLPLDWRFFPATVSRTGAPAALGLGLLFGIGLGPCSFAFLAPLLMLVFASATVEWTLSAAMLAAFALGHCGVITVAGTTAQKVQDVVAWEGRSRATVWIRRVCGGLVIAAGIYLLAR